MHDPSKQDAKTQLARKAEVIASAVRGEPAFWTCPRADVVRAMAHMELRTLRPGEEVYARNGAVDNTYLIVSGRLGITNRVGEIANRDSGFLGEEALIGMNRYLGSAVAVTDAVLLVIPKQVGKELSKHEIFHDFLVNSLNSRILQSDAAAAPDSKELVAQEKAKRSEESSGSWRILIGWILAAVVPACVYFFLKDMGSQNDPRLVYLFVVLSAVVTLWLFDVVIDYIPSVLALLGLIMYGVAPKEVVLGGFSSPAFFMALSIFALAAVVVTSGLGYRMLLWLLRMGPSHPAWQFFALFIAGVILTPAIPTASGRLAIVGPFIADLVYGLDQEQRKSVAPRLAAAILWGVGLFTTIFLSASPLNFLVYGLLSEQEQMNFQWLDWTVAASVCGLVLLMLFPVAAFLFFRKGARGIDLSKAMVKQQTHLMGRLKPLEIGAIISLVVLVVSFLTGSFHRLEMPWIAMAIMLALLMFGTIDRHQFRRRIDWGFLINLGAAIGIVQTMQYQHVDKLVANHLGWLSTMMEEDFKLFLFLLSVLVFLIRFIMPADAVILILCSVLMPTAAHLGINPWVVGFVILLIGEGFIWPYQADFYSQLCVISAK